MSVNLFLFFVSLDLLVVFKCSEISFSVYSLEEIGHFEVAHLAPSGEQSL